MQQTFFGFEEMRRQSDNGFAACNAADTAQYLGRCAAMALMEEVQTTPKPGLVDYLTNGAHRDMNPETFRKSTEALAPYFAQMAAEGLRQWQNPEACFGTIRRIGLRAEQAMYVATEGVNTHKGLIFSLGILCTATGMCFAEGIPITVPCIVEKEQQMVRRILLAELQAIPTKKKNPTAESHGEQLYKQFGVTGVRGEAINGFATVREIGLPVMREGLRRHIDFNLVKVQTLMTYMSRTEDTNVLSRTNAEVLQETQQMATAYLADGGAYARGGIERLVEMDRFFIAKNISHGGCADLLAITIFLAAVTQSDEVN